MTGDLSEWIKSEEAQGYTEDQLRAYLKQKKYPEAAVEEAVRISKRRKVPRYLTGWMPLIIYILIVGGWFFSDLLLMNVIFSSGEIKSWQVKQFISFSVGIGLLILLLWSIARIYVDVRKADFLFFKKRDNIIIIVSSVVSVSVYFIIVGANLESVFGALLGSVIYGVLIGAILSKVKKISFATAIISCITAIFLTYGIGIVVAFLYAMLIFSFQWEVGAIILVIIMLPMTLLNLIMISFLSLHLTNKFTGLNFSIIASLKKALKFAVILFVITLVVSVVFGFFYGMNIAHKTYDNLQETVTSSKEVAINNLHERFATKVLSNYGFEETESGPVIMVQGVPLYDGSLIERSEKIYVSCTLEGCDEVPKSSKFIEDYADPSNTYKLSFAGNSLFIIPELKQNQLMNVLEDEELRPDLKFVRSLLDRRMAAYDKLFNYNPQFPEGEFEMLINFISGKMVSQSNEIILKNTEIGIELRIPEDYIKQEIEYLDSNKNNTTVFSDGTLTLDEHIASMGEDIIKLKEYGDYEPGSVEGFPGFISSDAPWGLVIKGVAEHSNELIEMRNLGNDLKSVREKAGDEFKTLLESRPDESEESRALRLKIQEANQGFIAAESCRGKGDRILCEEEVAVLTDNANLCNSDDCFMKIVPNMLSPKMCNEVRDTNSCLRHYESK